MLKLVRAIFYAAAVFAFVMATLPKPPQLPGEPSDKVMHIVAFAVLGGLAAIGFPRQAAIRLVLGLVAFGASIELVQSIPALHRDAEIMDLIADFVAAAVGVWIMRASKLRIPD